MKLLFVYRNFQKGKSGTLSPNPIEKQQNEFIPHSQ